MEEMEMTYLELVLYIVMFLIGIGVGLLAVWFAKKAKLP